MSSISKAALSVAFILVMMPVAHAETSFPDVLACKNISSYSLIEERMKGGDLSALILTLEGMLNAGYCLILPGGVHLTAEDYADDKACFKFEGSGDGCMWIRRHDVIGDLP